MLVPFSVTKASPFTPEALDSKDKSRSFVKITIESNGDPIPLRIVSSGQPFYNLIGYSIQALDGDVQKNYRRKPT